jgi:predicted TPR repeat methyltransferase
MKDHFKNRASSWDKDRRIDSALKIASAIKSEIQLNKNMKIIDFGAGTGLLGFEIAKKVQKVYGVDISKEMIKKLKEKNTPSLHVEPICQNIINQPLQDTYDGLVSSMTLHHIEKLDNFFEVIYKNIKDGGFIAIADLQKEDGTFHSDNSGVFHFGFDEKNLKSIVQNVGFKDVKIKHINTIKKPHGDFGIFLLSAFK